MEHQFPRGHSSESQGVEEKSFGFMLMLLIAFAMLLSTFGLGLYGLYGLLQLFIEESASSLSALGAIR